MVSGRGQRSLTAPQGEPKTSCAKKEGGLLEAAGGEQGLRKRLLFIVRGRFTGQGEEPPEGKWEVLTWWLFF